MAKVITQDRGKCRISYYVEGRRKFQRTDIPFTAQGIKQADKVRLAAIETAKLAAVAPVKTAAPTMQQLSELRLSSKRFAPTTSRKICTVLNKYWLPYLHETLVTDVTQMLLLQIVQAEMLHLSEKSKKDAVGVIGSVLEQAVPEYLNANPARKITFKVEKKAIDPFTNTERDALLAEMSGALLLFYTLRFYAGLRPGEVIALTWTDFLGEKLNVSKTRSDGITRNTTKNHEQRMVNLHPKVVALLQKHAKNKQCDHIVCTDDGVAYSRYEAFSSKLNALQLKLGIRHRDPYNARHTCATMMLEAGLEPAYCAKQLGHRLDQFLNTYASWANEEASMVQHAKWAGVE